jgi:sugar phosphate permease
MMKLNKVIMYLVLSDLIFFTGWGLISPIFAIYILESIAGGNAFVVGMSSAVHLVVRSLLRVPFGIRADKDQKRAYRYMFFGLLVASLIPIGFIYSTSPLHIYLLQALLGVTLAMSTAGWTSVFARHMDRGKESTEWGVDAVAVGLGPGIAGALGGIAVTYFSFNIVFVIVAAMGIIGSISLLFIKRDVMKNRDLMNIHSNIARHHEVLRLKKRIH